MLLLSLKAERLKLKRSPVWLAFLIIPVLPAFIGTFNYLSNLELLTSTWYSLWTQHTLFACFFFMPSLIAIYASYLWRLEHLNHNWNQVLTVPVSIKSIWLAKLITAAEMLFLSDIWIGLLFVFSGLLAGIPLPVPFELFEWIFCGFFGGLAICSVQLFISLILPSFSIPVGISLIGGILSLPFIAKGKALLYPYALLCYGMRANNPKLEVALVPFLISCAFFIFFFSILSIWFIANCDRKA